MLTAQQQLDVINKRLDIETGALEPFSRRIRQELADRTAGGDSPEDRLDWLSQYLKLVAEGCRVKFRARRELVAEKAEALIDSVPAGLNRHRLHNWLTGRPSSADILGERAGVMHNQLEEWRILAEPLSLRVLDGAEMLGQVDPNWFWHFSTMHAFFMWSAIPQIRHRLDRLADAAGLESWRDLLPIEKSYLGYDSNWFSANCLQSSWRSSQTDHDADLSRAWIKAARRARRRWLLTKIRSHRGS